MGLSGWIWPSPGACADSPELVGRVAALEQGTCDIASALAEFRAGPCNDRLDRFQDNGDGTTTDICTGLTWKQGDMYKAGVTASWTDAISICEELVFAGHADWRLPSAQEYENLLFFHRATDKGSVLRITLRTIENNYWTSTKGIEGSLEVFSVQVEPLYFGRTPLNGGATKQPFLAVRGPIAP